MALSELVQCDGKAAADKIQIKVDKEKAIPGQCVCELYYNKLGEFDFEKSRSTIPKERVKIRKRGDHLIPITPLAKALITELVLMRNKAGYL